MEQIEWQSKLIDRNGGPALLRGGELTGLVVAREVALADRSVREFAHFSSFKTFLKYHFSTPVSDRCFYEVIFGTKPQKFYLDLDLERSRVADDAGDASDGFFRDLAQEVFEGVIAAVIAVLAGLGVTVEPADFLVYQSHGADKFSFHVLLATHCLASNKEARRLFDLVKRLVPPHLSAFVDGKVYGPHQQLRLLGSHKMASDRTKQYMPTFRYRGEDIVCRRYENEGELFRDSLVGATLSTRLLDIPGHAAAPSLPIPHDESELPPEILGNVMRLVSQATGVDQDDLPFRFGGVTGNIVSLRRTRPSRCRICERVHEHENPYLFIPPPTLVDGDTAQEVYKVLYTCRRCEPPVFLDMGSIARSADVGRASRPATQDYGGESREPEKTQPADATHPDEIAAKASERATNIPESPAKAPERATSIPESPAKSPESPVKDPGRATAQKNGEPALACAAKVTRRPRIPPVLVDSSSQHDSWFEERVRSYDPRGDVVARFAKNSAAKAQQAKKYSSRFTSRAAAAYPSSCTHVGARNRWSNDE